MVAQNRKARHDYFIEETFEAGLALTGTGARLGQTLGELHHHRDVVGRFVEPPRFLVHDHTAAALD